MSYLSGISGTISHWQGLCWDGTRQTQSADKFIIDDRSCLLLVQMRKIFWFKLA